MDIREEASVDGGVDGGTSLTLVATKASRPEQRVVVKIIEY